jgi:transcriptional regulator with XRE-family HTH domain
MRSISEFNVVRRCLVRSVWVDSLAIRGTVCDDLDPGTREGFILVSKTPSKKATKSKGKPNGEGSAALAKDDGAPRRAELADFLRNRREAIRPEEAGLPGGGRRRTPGLRREEVAQLAGVGTTWYTWLEQGRDVRASASVLEAIAGALELTPAEHAHLMLLGRGEEVPPGRAPKETINPTIKRLVENLGASPSCITGRRFDFLAWNRAHSVVFGDPGELPEGRRNLLWRLFMEPAFRSLHPDWEEGARRIVARFRSEAARYVGDPDFEDLISALQEGSPEFREWWDLHEVATSGVGRKIVKHPTAGKLVFEHAVFRPQETPEQRLVLYSATPQAGTPEKLAKLLAEQD